MRPPRNPFGAEPEHVWCYFFERAELARQRSDWPEILGLESDVRSLGYAPEDPLEWLPFIEANARAGDVERAASLSRQVVNELPRARKGVCAVWQRAAESPPGYAGRAPEMLEEFACTP